MMVMIVSESELRCLLKKYIEVVATERLDLRANGYQEVDTPCGRITHVSAIR